MKKNSNLGNLAVICFYIAIGSVLLSFSLLIGLKIFASPDTSIWFLKALLNMFLPFLGLYLVISFFVRCPSCGSRPIFNLIASAHNNARNDAFGALFKWFVGKVDCYKCGSELDTNGL